MDPTQDIDLPVPAPRAPRSRRLAAAGERVVLWLHRRAERMDLVPSEFGRGVSLDDTDGRSLAREWLRQARLWAGYNPEEMLALKAGGVALGVALLVLVALVRAMD